VRAIVCSLRWLRAAPAGQESLVQGLPYAPVLSLETPALPRLPAHPCALALLSRPRWDYPPLPLRWANCCLPDVQSCRLPHDQYFRGSITRLSHSLSTLRRWGHPQTTQDSLPACWLCFCRMDLSSTGRVLEVSRCHWLIYPPRQAFAWRNERLPIPGQDQAATATAADLREPTVLLCNNSDESQVEVSTLKVFEGRRRGFLSRSMMWVPNAPQAA
jgi:hypothetical protein